MATNFVLPAFLCFSLFLLSLFPGKVMVNACQSSPAKNTWCVANPATSEADLQNNIEFACSSTDCSLIQYGGACFDPQTIIFHASVAMNLYYQSVGRNSWNCYFGGSGLIVTTDPSYGNCKYACEEIC